MKTTILILLISTAMPMAAQSVSDKIIAFAESKEGKRVKSGDCYEFVEAAIKSADKHFDGSFRKKVSIDTVKAGDVVKFSGCKFADGTRAASHWGIVVSVKDSVITLYHQNVDCTLKESVVVLDEISLVGMTGKVVFYRRD